MSSPGMWLPVLTLQDPFKSLLDGTRSDPRALHKVFLFHLTFRNDFVIKNDRAVPLCHHVLYPIPVIPIQMSFLCHFPVMVTVLFAVSIE